MIVSDWAVGLCAAAAWLSGSTPLSCRLAEAFAEKLHAIVRKELWGYAQDEHLSNEDLLKVKYQVQLEGQPPTRGEVLSQQAHSLHDGMPLLAPLHSAVVTRQERQQRWSRT